MKKPNAEVQRIKELLVSIYEGEAWHGPSVRSIIDQISVDIAAQRLSGSHNIIEMLRHMVIWREFVVARLEGDDAYDVIADDNWTHVSELQAFAWLEAKEKLDNSQQKMLSLLEQMPDAQLYETVPNRPYNFYVLLHGIIQHDLYHLGQIVLLKKPQLTVTVPGQTM